MQQHCADKDYGLSNDICIMKEDVETMALHLATFQQNIIWTKTLAHT